MPILNGAYFVVFLGALIFVHELGHFLVAKALGVKVLKFSIGFGPAIFSLTRGETEYRLAIVPLGGYVKMAGETPHEELSAEEARRGFLAQAPWRRGLIVSAGPVFNLVFPVIAYFFVYLGDYQAYSTRIGTVEPGMPAALAKLQPGDRIVKVDGTKVATFDELREAVQDVWEKEITLTVERKGQQFETQLIPSRQVDNTPLEKVTRGMIGISPVVQHPFIGVPHGSRGEAAGLRSFDRILAVNGQPVRDELVLQEVVAKAEGTLSLTVARTELVAVPAAAVTSPSVLTVSIEKGEGEGFAALGVERGDTYVASVTPGSPADQAGLEVGDKLLSVNDQPLASWHMLQLFLRRTQEQPFTLTWSHAGQTKSQTVQQVKVEVDDGLGRSMKVADLGVGTRPTELELITLHRGPVEAAVAACKTVPAIIAQIAMVLGKLFTGSVSFDTVGGPVMVYKIAVRSAQEGWETYLKSMAVLSVNLGLINLLPIPILDGFQLLSAGWESVRRRPIPMRAREIANMVGLVLLVAIMVGVLINDIWSTIR